MYGLFYSLCRPLGIKLHGLEGTDHHPTILVKELVQALRSNGTFGHLVSQRVVQALHLLELVLHEAHQPWS